MSGKTENSENFGRRQDDLLRLRELELETKYQIDSLSDSFFNLKQFFDNFKTYVDNTLEGMKDKIEGMSMTLESFMDRQEKRNEKVWNRLNLITVLVVLQLFDVSVDIVDVFSNLFMRVV